MLQSHVVDVEGRFVGAAVRQSDGYRFVAVDCRLGGLHGRVLPSLAEVQRAARAALLAAPVAPPLPPPGPAPLACAI